MTAAPAPALTIPGPPLPPPVNSSVPESLSILPESATGNEIEAVPEPAVRSRVPALLKAVEVWPLLFRIAADWKSKVAPD